MVRAFTFTVDVHLFNFADFRDASSKSKHFLYVFVLLMNKSKIQESRFDL